MGIKLLSLSNNHTMDQSASGFFDTIDTLNKAKIPYVGGGANQQEASKPYIFELSNKKIGVYACCDHEYSWTEDYGCGANGFDPFESLDEIADLKSKTDYVIVLYHGGREHYRYPTPYLKKLCRKIIDKGGDLVLCQHTHCVGTQEIYNGGTIVYGQGNFIFDYVKVDFWKTSLLVSVDVDNDFKIEYIPIEQNNCFVKLSHDEEILKDFYSRSEEIKVEGFIEKNFLEYAKWMQKNYYYNGVFKNYVDPNLITGPFRKAVENCIRCEVHREMILGGLKAEKQEEF